jgi:proline iminopeptidase
MIKLISTILLLITTFFAQGQDLYKKAFGDREGKPIIFLHGGPGYNCVNFEATSAQALADQGFYVIVYDRRGEGRSPDPKAQFTFQEAFDDLNALYQAYDLSQASLIGHSFGGILATLFTEKHPEKVQNLILLGAPVSLQETFKTILSTSKALYQAEKDSANLYYISILESMDTTSLQYSSYCFMHAMQNGFYQPETPSDEAKAIYARFQTDSLLKKYASQMTYQAPRGFWKNEHYTTLDLTNSLTQLKQQGTNIYGLYGKEDGLYAASQVAALRQLLGAEQLRYLENCSHSVFIDQQAQFIEAIKAWTR